MEKVYGGGEMTKIYVLTDDGLFQKDEFKKIYRFFLGLRDYIAMEILLDGVLSSPDISVLSAWIEKKTIYDSTQNKKEAMITLLKSIFSSNDVFFLHSSRPVDPDGVTSYKYFYL